MSEGIQTAIGLCFLIGVYVLTRYGIVLRTRKAAHTIVCELKHMGAFDPTTAVPLNYHRTDHFKIGMRDFRPKALEMLIMNHVVKKTDDGGFYLAAEGGDRS